MGGSSVFLPDPLVTPCPAGATVYFPHPALGSRCLLHSVSLALSHPSFEQHLWSNHCGVCHHGKAPWETTQEPWGQTHLGSSPSTFNYKLGDIWQVTSLCLSDFCFSQLHLLKKNDDVISIGLM